MKILYSHNGTFKKEGWGRTYPMARAFAQNGHDVTLITTSETISLRLKKIKLDNVLIIIFPEIAPYKLRSTGFGILSLFLKLIYTTFKRFDLLISDVGHRPSSGWPCILNKKIYKNIYLSEWWDLYGKGGDYDKKPKWFKLIYGWFELHSEINNKKKADGVIVLSNFMKNRALSLGIEENKITIVHGGSLTDVIKPNISENIKSRYNLNPYLITFGYIGMSDGEISDLDPFLRAISRKTYSGKIKFLTYGKNISDFNLEKYHLKDIILEMGWCDYFENQEIVYPVDIFVLIKRNNDKNEAGWPNKLGDYLSFGRPVMINPYSDVLQYTNDLKNGIIQVNYNEEDIAKEIDKVLNNEYNLILMGLHNREYAKINLDWSHKCNQILELYAKIK